MVWLTGLSGAGKTTLARGLEARLLERGILPAVLDGDVLRTGLSAGLGFSLPDREENVRRAAEAALLMARTGIVVIVALISPLRSGRERAAARAQSDGLPWAEVFVNAPLAVCEQRDPKGLYRKARAGEIHSWTGIDSPYEPPLAPSLELRTDRESIDSCVSQLTSLAVSLVRPDQAGVSVAVPPTP